MLMGFFIVSKTMTFEYDIIIATKWSDNNGENEDTKKAFRNYTGLGWGNHPY